MNTFVYNPNANNASIPYNPRFANLKYAKFGNWMIPNMGNAPERTPEENLERRRKSYQNYATSMKSQKNSYKSRMGAMNNNNNVVTNNDENAWTVNTNTNEWRVEVGNNNSIEHVPRNLRYNKTWRKKTRKARRRASTKQRSTHRTRRA